MFKQRIQETFELYVPNMPLMYLDYADIWEHVKPMNNYDYSTIYELGYIRDWDSDRKVPVTKDILKNILVNRFKKVGKDHLILDIVPYFREPVDQELEKLRKENKQLNDKDKLLDNELKIYTEKDDLKSRINFLKNQISEKTALLGKYQQQAKQAEMDTKEKEEFIKKFSELPKDKMKAVMEDSEILL